MNDDMMEEEDVPTTQNTQSTDTTKKVAKEHSYTYWVKHDPNYQSTVDTKPKPINEEEHKRQSE